MDECTRQKVLILSWKVESCKALVDGSGSLDLMEVGVALADLGALDGVLASAAAELFEEFDSDGTARGLPVYS